jgi:hypothetical protein
MRRTRALAAQAPAIVLSVLAIALSLGGGAYASTQLAAGHPAAASQASAGSAAAVSWHPLSLRNGWRSANSLYSSGNPTVSIRSGIVYLSGSLYQPSPGSETFAILPRTYRPVHNMWITVYTYGDTSGTLYIGKNGTMDSYSSGACGTLSTSECYTSLAAVSYPVNS